MVGVYNHVWMAPYNVEYITEFQIEKKMKTHDKAYVKGVILATSLAMLQNMIDGKVVVSIYFEQAKLTQLIFSGYISQMNVSEVGEHREVMLELTGLTQALDRATAFADYQDVTKNNAGMIAELMKSYPDIAYEIHCRQENIESFLIQYDETDYEFATRLLSRVEAPVYTTTEGQFGRICFGLNTRDTGVELEQAEYEMFYEDGIQYKLVYDEYLDLAARYCYQNGESLNTYQLGTKESCMIQPIKNEKVTGISLDGVIIDCKRDKVKIELNKTLPCEEDKRKWFAYSSPAASSDGSGWYCMPKKGEEIRLFSPTNDESEAYVISAIREGQSAQQAHQPVDKVWTNTAGQEIDFTENGVSLSSNGGAVSMDLRPDGTIEIIANKNLEIYADKDIMLKANKGMSISSVTGITLANDTGSALMIDRNITESANRIKNNC